MWKFSVVLIDITPLYCPPVPCKASVFFIIVVCVLSWTLLLDKINPHQHLCGQHNIQSIIYFPLRCVHLVLLPPGGHEKLSVQDTCSYVYNDEPKMIMVRWKSSSIVSLMHLCHWPEVFGHIIRRHIQSGHNVFEWELIILLTLLWDYLYYMTGMEMIVMVKK